MMPISDYTAGLAFEQGAAASPLGSALNNTPGGVVDVPGLSRTVPIPPNVFIPQAPRVPPPYTPGWYTIGEGSYKFFGIGWDAAEGFKIGNGWIVGAMPFPIGFAPPNFYGLTDDWLEWLVKYQLNFNQISSWHQEFRNVYEEQQQAAFAYQQLLDIATRDLGPEGLLYAVLNGWLVDP